MKPQQRIPKLVCALAVVAASIGFAATATAETWRVGTECTYHPFNYREADGKLAGFDVDIAREIGKRAGAEIEFVCQDWDGMIPALLANKFDLIVASMSITPERQEKIDFSRSYRFSIGRVLAKKGQGDALFDADGNPDSKGWETMKIGLQRASTYDSYAQKYVPSANIKYYDKMEPMVLDLKAGRVDAIMTNPMKAHLSFLSTPEGEDYELVGPDLKDPEIFGPGVGVGLRKGNDALLGQINDALNAMIDDGTYGTINKKYFPFEMLEGSFAKLN